MDEDLQLHSKAYSSRLIDMSEAKPSQAEPRQGKQNPAKCQDTGPAFFAIDENLNDF